MKDPSDIHTIDFAGHDAPVCRGQVLADRQRHYAVVAKVGRKYAHIVCAHAGSLSLTKLTAPQIVDGWIEADYPFAKAVDALLEMGVKRGITDAARIALETLRENGRDPVQNE